MTDERRREDPERRRRYRAGDWPRSGSPSNDPATQWHHRGELLTLASGTAAAVRPTWRGRRLLIVAGGLVYSVGAAVYALRRPDQAPVVPGYHEVFHALGVAVNGCTRYA